VKKGWQRGKVVKKSETTVLEREFLRQQDQQYDVKRILPKKNKRPETSLDFDRDWRRLRTKPEKRECEPHRSSLLILFSLRYLIRTGLKRTSKILRNDLSAEIFQEIIELLLQESPVEEVSSTNINDDPCTAQIASPESAISDPVPWLKAFSELARFSLMVTFLDRSVRESLVAYISSNRCDSLPTEERDFLLSKYSI
jgi:hypothetical protein